MARTGLHLAERAQDPSPTTPSSTPRSVSRCRACGSRTPRLASAARSLKGSSSLGVQGVRHRLHPGTPIGTCMVWPEGACAAYYNFGRLHRETALLVVGEPSDHRGRFRPSYCSRCTRTPNALGYCGPAGAATLETVARGESARGRQRWTPSRDSSVARGRTSSCWPNSRASMIRSTGAWVRGYWTRQRGDGGRRPGAVRSGIAGPLGGSGRSLLEVPHRRSPARGRTDVMRSTYSGSTRGRACSKRACRSRCTCWIRVASATASWSP